MALDRERVVKTALGLMDEVGLDQVTLRRLAKQLGVQAPALYWHFKSKQDLLDQMADYLWQEVPMPREPEPGEDWGDWLTRRGRAVRQALLARRDAALLAASTKPRDTQWDQIEFQLGVLVQAGFTPTEAVRGMFTISNYVAGFVLEEQGEKRQDPDAPQPAPEEIEALLKEFDQHQPLLARAFREVGDPQADANFEYGLQLIITGMRSALASGRSRGRRL